MPRPHAGRHANAVLLAATLLAGAPLAAAAEELEAAAIAAGEVEYLSACAGCHGRDATGDGPMADLLSMSTPDLTKMAERNDGSFPFVDALRIIDGRQTLRAHGGDMPVWGERYSSVAMAGETGADRAGEAAMFVHGRIVSLAYYLESIQR